MLEAGDRLCVPYEWYEGCVPDIPPAEPHARGGTCGSVTVIEPHAALTSAAAVAIAAVLRLIGFLPFIGCRIPVSTAYASD